MQLIKTNFLSGGVCALSLLFIFSCSQQVQQTNDQQKVQNAVDSVRLALAKDLGRPVPSINVLIQTSSEKLFVSSVDSGNKPLTADTYFRFASNTKNFTATAILNMYEDGWLDYKAKITDTIPGSDMPYVPATADWNIPNKNEITIEELLQHSAGVFDVDNDSIPKYNDTYVEHMLLADPLHQFSADELANVIATNKLSYFTPRSGYHYSNTGYSILGKIIKRVYSFHAGKPKTYSDYLNDSITGSTARVPLKVHFPVQASDNDLPSPYVTGTTFLRDSTQHFNRYNVSAHVAEGNGYGTMNDLNTYIRTLMKGENVLKPSTVELMKTDTSAHNKSYALGCTHTPNLGYGHNGAKIGYLSLMAYDPDTDVSVVVMMPLWDLRNNMDSFAKCFHAIYDAGYAARKALGYPGKP
ncbi:MAG: serine hydrolase domain-containing protein [Chitinophagales bacterium]